MILKLGTSVKLIYHYQKQEIAPAPKTESSDNTCPRSMCCSRCFYGCTRHRSKSIFLSSFESCSWFRPEPSQPEASVTHIRFLWFVRSGQQSTDQHCRRIGETAFQCCPPHGDLLQKATTIHAIVASANNQTDYKTIVWTLFDPFAGAVNYNMFWVAARRSTPTPTLSTPQIPL